MEVLDHHLHRLFQSTRFQFLHNEGTLFFENENEDRLCRSGGHPGQRFRHSVSAIPLYRSGMPGRDRTGHQCVPLGKGLQLGGCVHATSEDVEWVSHSAE